MSYRNVRVLPPLDTAKLDKEVQLQLQRRQAEASTSRGTSEGLGDEGLAAAGVGAVTGGYGGGAAAGGPGQAPVVALPTCFELASDAVVASLTPETACQVLQVRGSSLEA